MPAGKVVYIEYIYSVYLELIKRYHYKTYISLSMTKTQPIIYIENRKGLVNTLTQEQSLTLLRSKAKMSKLFNYELHCIHKYLTGAKYKKIS